MMGLALTYSISWAFFLSFAQKHSISHWRLHQPTYMLSLQHRRQSWTMNCKLVSASRCNKTQVENFANKFQVILIGHEAAYVTLCKKNSMKKKFIDEIAMFWCQSKTWENQFIATFRDLQQKFLFFASRAINLRLDQLLGFYRGFLATIWTVLHWVAWKIAF